LAQAVKIFKTHITECAKSCLQKAQKSRDEMTLSKYTNSVMANTLGLE